MSCFSYFRLSSFPALGRSNGSPQWWQEEGVFLLQALDHISCPPSWAEWKEKYSGGWILVFYFATEPQCDSGTRLRFSAEGQKASVTGPGSHSPASQPSSISRVSGWGEGCSSPLRPHAVPGGLHYRRNPSRTYQLAAPRPACGMFDWTVTSEPLSPGLGPASASAGVAGGNGEGYGGKSLESEELGQGTGSGVQLASPASCPLLTGAPSFPR